MTESKSAIATLQRPSSPSRPDIIQRETVSHLPSNTFLYGQHTTRDGGKFPAPIQSIPEGGLTVTISSTPDYIRRVRGINEHWHRVRKLGSSDPVTQGGQELWVCIERVKGVEGGHWRGSDI